MPVLVFHPRDVRLFCSKCDRREPFNLVVAEDLLARDQDGDSQLYAGTTGTVQVFALSYLCQGCKRVPELFTVRREGPRLTLCGRAPIEHVVVPGQIPKDVKCFYRGAIVAHQSGETLAANFMLRTLIEQFARAATKAKRAERDGSSADDLDETKWKADQVLDVYAELLPDAL